LDYVVHSVIDAKAAVDVAVLPQSLGYTAYTALQGGR